MRRGEKRGGKGSERGRGEGSFGKLVKRDISAPWRRRKRVSNTSDSQRERRRKGERKKGDLKMTRGHRHKRGDGQKTLKEEENAGRGASQTPGSLFFPSKPAPEKKQEREKKKLKKGRKKG